MLGKDIKMDKEQTKTYISEIFGLLRESYEKDDFDVRMLDVCEKAIIFKLTIEDVPNTRISEPCKVESKKWATQ